MASKKEDMKRLKERRDELLRQIEALRNQVTGLELAMQVLGSDSAPKVSNGKRQSVKAALLELLEDAGTTGLNAAAAVEMGTRRGIQLDRGTVSSLLSRFKRDGILVYENDKYRLIKFVEPSQTADGSSLTRILPH